MTRYFLVLIFFELCFVLIGVKLFYWQVVKGDELKKIANDQYYFSLTLSPKRGEIKFSDFSSLVSNKLAYLVYAEPGKIIEKTEFAKKISEILDLDEQTVKDRLNSKKIVWIFLKRKVDEETVKKLSDLNLTGIGLEKESIRSYVEGTISAHIIGFVGSDENGDDKGYFGLEGFYDRALRGKMGSLVQEKDAQGFPIVLGNQKRIPTEDGQTLILNLDRGIQFIIEDKLKNAIEKYGAKEGLVVVADPKTLGILGMASYPNFDPSRYWTYEENFYKNPLVAFTYEPGSTFKTLIMAAAVNEKVITTQTKYNEGGPVKVGEYSIKTWNDKYQGEITATQILEKSSNPGMVFIGEKLGKEKLLKYLKDFGLGQKTGIDLEEEVSSLLRFDIDWKPIDLATVTFGQGIAVTPIQMIRAISAIANGGDVLEPKVAKMLIEKNGKQIEIRPKKIRSVISKTTAKIVTEMMVSAVTLGDARWARPEGFRIAGKTGTAQIPVAGHYDAEKTIASFVGFAPADDPRFIVLTILREPTSSPWGSETAAPLFFDIARELFTYMNIPPTN